MINQKVKTEIGEGIEQGRFAELDGFGLVRAVSQLVRITINDATVGHLKDANCLTPNAKRSALFVFPMSQKGQGIAEWLIIAALLVLVIVFAGDVLGWPW